MIPRLVLAAAVWAGVATGQSPTFKSSIDKVQVDVLVTRGGQPVTDMSSSEFEVSDNGVPQRVDSSGSFEEAPLNLVLVVDGSSSVAGRRAELLRGACNVLLDQLRKEDRAALIVFAETVVIRSRLTHDLAFLRSAVELPYPSGQTSLVDAVQASLALAESEPGRALVLVFTDGVDVSSYLTPDAVLGTSKRSDAVIYGVTLRGESKPAFIRELTEASGGALFETGSPSDIGETFKAVLAEFRHRYVLTYTPTGVQNAGWHKLRVTVKRRGTSVRARPGYLR